MSPVLNVPLYCGLTGCWNLSIGALETTNMGTVLNLDPNNPAYDRLYVDTVLDLLFDRSMLEVRRAKNKVEAKLRFAPVNKLKQWDEVFK